MTTTPRLNLAIERGTKWAPRITDWTAEDGTVVAPNDYSDASFVIFDADGAAMATLTEGDGITLGATTIELLLTPNATAALDRGTFQYQMTLTGDDTYPFELLRGHVTIRDVP